MPQVRALVRLGGINTLPRDWATNTVYFDTDGELTADYEVLAQDVADAFAAIGFLAPSVSTVTVTTYNMADAKPREPKATKVATRSATASPMPREVAVCLSYYADRNIPGHRGRLFLGPIGLNTPTERPDATFRQVAGQLAGRLSGIGGINVQWVLYSPKRGTYENITNWYVDDEWDTMRSRGLRATARTAGTVNG